MVSHQSSITDLLTDIYNRMYSALGPQHWWPGDTPFEVCVGAILTQNTSWTNVSRAIDNLKEAGVMGAASLYELPLERLAELIRPAGYYNIKAQRLHNFLTLLMESYDGELGKIFSQGLEPAREELLSVKGIGPETADSMLLYAGGLPTFVVDAYTIRALMRHDIVDENADYHSVRQLFMDNLPEDAALFNEYHALWVNVGKSFCKKGKPRCDQCPLNGV